MASVAKGWEDFSPLFDHDSCFKGKSVNGIYFPTTLSFADTLNLLKTNLTTVYEKCQPDLKRLYSFTLTGGFKKYFLQFFTENMYDALIKRIRDVVGDTVEMGIFSS